MKLINKIIKVLYCFSGKFVKITKYDSIIQHVPVINFIFNKKPNDFNSELTLTYNKNCKLTYFYEGAWHLTDFIDNIKGYIKIIIQKKIKL